jgi:phage baseplate assembly protein gpV/phage protein D
MKSVTTLPQVTISVNRQPLSPQALRALSGIRVQQRLSLPSLCELRFQDAPDLLAVTSPMAAGASLQIGIDGYRDPLFVGEVTAIEHLYGPAHEHEIHVRGYDLLHRLRKRQSIQVHTQVTPAQLVRELAADLGLRIDAPEDGPTWQILIQDRRSDFDLIAEVIQQCGFYLFLHDDLLRLMTLEGSGEVQPLSLGTTLLEARIQVSGEPACRSVTASGWNALQAESYTGRAATSRVVRQIRADVVPGSVGGSGDVELIHESAQNRGHTEALAQGELDRRVAHEVALWGVASGDPRLRPGTGVDVRGVADSLSGRYILTSVTHTLDERGFLSELSSLPPPPITRPSESVMALGQVTHVNDPAHLGRVRVTLPTYGNVETDWMHVLSAGAGANKGLVVLPDVGDQVVMLFSHANPGQGVVLGGVYGMAGPTDSGVEGSAVRRYTLLTAAGQRIVIDDSRSTIRLEDNQGSYVELSPGRVRVHAATKLELEAPGHPVVIRGASIDFERA